VPAPVAAAAAVPAPVAAAAAPAPAILAVVPETPVARESGQLIALGTDN
jgi:hypothetical protein